MGSLSVETLGSMEVLSRLPKFSLKWSVPRSKSSTTTPESLRNGDDGGVLISELAAVDTLDTEAMSFEGATATFERRSREPENLGIVQSDGR
jgi:hypothetical protein